MLLDEDVLSLTSFDPAASALLASSQEEQEMAAEVEEDMLSETSQPPCPAYAELLGVMECSQISAAMEGCEGRNCSWPTR